MTCRNLRPGDPVRAISLWEPWASLMAVGAKSIETRPWFTKYRGPLLICAAKRRAKREIDVLLSDEIFQRGLRPLAGGRAVTVDDLHFGQAVAMVDLVSVSNSVTAGRPAWQVPASLPDLFRGLSPDEKHFGDYSPGRFAWITAGRRRIRPFPVTGRQGLFQVRLPANLKDWEPGCAD